MILPRDSFGGTTLVRLLSSGKAPRLVRDDDRGLNLWWLDLPCFFAEALALGKSHFLIIFFRGG